MSKQNLAEDVEFEFVSANQIKREDLKFKTKSDVFDYFFVRCLESGCEVCSAAEKASNIAETVAKVKSIPDTEPDVVDLWIKRFERMASQAEQHPKITEFFVGIMTGVGTFATGLVAGKSVDNNNDVSFNEDMDQVDFEEIEEIKDEKSS